jgi:rhodanese-related sulfurtransferase
MILNMKNFQSVSLLFIFFVLIAFSACGQQAAKQNEQKFLLLAPVEFKAALEKETDVQLIDVRTPAEVKKGHLKGAKNLNLFDDDFKQQLEKLDKEKPVYVYCQVGGRSGECAAMLKEMGFKNITDMDGGFGKWQKAGLPVEQ